MLDPKTALQADPPAAEKAVGHVAVPAVTRAIAILRLLGASDTPMSLNAIASRLSLVPSTCLSILRTLVREELVAFEPQAKRYSLDAGILTLARNALRPSSFGRVIQPDLDALARSHPVTVLAARLVSLEHIVVLATSGADRGMRLHVEPGSRFPALMSASGRCVAAFGPFTPQEIAHQFALVRWENPPRFATWTREVELARDNGYSIDSGNYMAGITVVAAPILDRDGVMSHVVVTVGLTEQIGRGDLGSLVRDLKAVATRFTPST